MANIFDVARLAGVSKTTVSKVLNDQYGVSEKTRKKVLEAVNTLNFVPNHAAKTLVTHKSGVIGVIYDSSFKNSVYIELSIFLQKYAEAHGYTLVFCNYNRDPIMKSKYINHFMGGAADGIIFFGSDNEDINFIEKIKARRYPLVVIENYFENVSINNILIDNVSGSQDVVNYLTSLGHKKIAYITSNLDQRVASDRFNGYIRALQKNSLPFNQEYVIFSNYSDESIRDSINKLISLKDLPTAICFFNDIMAYGAIWELNKLGYSVPNDFSVVGFDNFAGTFEFFKGAVNLTSVSQPLDEVSKAAIDLLVENIEDKSMDCKAMSFKTQLVIGDSCKNIL